LGALEGDGRVDRQLGVLVQLRRLAPLLLDLGEPRAKRDVVVADQLRARHVEVVQIEVDERRLAGAPEVAVDLAEPAQPVVVLVVDDVGLADQIAVVALGVDPPALLDHRLGLIGRRFDRVEPARHHVTLGIRALTCGSSPDERCIRRLCCGSLGTAATGGALRGAARVASPTMSSARRWRSARLVSTSPDTICERSSSGTNSGRWSLDGSTTTP